MRIITSLQNKLADFWDWSGIKADIYDNQCTTIDETLYIEWDNLISLTQEAVMILKSNSQKKEMLVKPILEVLALDHENESLLDFCEEELGPTETECLIKASISFPLTGARWQMAELIGRKREKGWLKYVLLLTNDSNKYVQRRALLSLVHLDSDLASKIAFQKIRDEDDMIRLVSLRILNETSSGLLEDAIWLLENDPYSLVREEVSKIVSNLREN
ncbi:HEAT repeat domain-containing protein [Paenibacillus sp. J22TS3]|uniref:HEAT repeat domain-containing protein n=1 Tax=Paenibacillus sp. J22TS3 TaxID=2807192 RepID=UPI001B234E75|nr:HEAT repeat domain-containing protein [Paenibacillus sp. J22TS3]GIP20641.1 hypothetical protein J22TS3_09160 [Paenibacillus sp. J22TS3]